MLTFVPSKIVHIFVARSLLEVYWILRSQAAALLLYENEAEKKVIPTGTLSGCDEAAISVG